MAGEARTRVAAARLAAGLTQAELAEAVGASTRQIIRIEKGEFRPRLALASRLAKVLNLTLDDLLEGAA